MDRKKVSGMKQEADSTRKVMHIKKQRLVICNEKDTDGQARLTTHKE